MSQVAQLESHEKLQEKYHRVPWHGDFSLEFAIQNRCFEERIKYVALLSIDDANPNFWMSHPACAYSSTLWFLQVCKISPANPTPTTVSYQKGSSGWHFLCSNMLHPGWFDIVRDGFPCSSLFMKHLTCKGLLSTLRVSPKNQIIEYSNSKQYIMVNLPIPPP